jgi:hypothetical protein
MHFSVRRWPSLFCTTLALWVVSDAVACGGSDASGIDGPGDGSVGGGAGASMGGTGGGRAGQGGTTAEAGAGCANSLDCLGGEQGKTVCSVPTGQCVACLTVEDCGPQQGCVHNACVTYTSCQSSLDCPSSFVCDHATSRCVDCVADADCNNDERCVANTCRKRCISDKTCTSLGLVCDLAGDIAPPAHRMPIVGRTTFAITGTVPSPCVRPGARAAKTARLVGSRRATRPAAVGLPRSLVQPARAAPRAG